MAQKKFESHIADLIKKEIGKIHKETNILDLVLTKMSGWIFYPLGFKCVGKWLIKNYAIIHSIQNKFYLKIVMIYFLKKSTKKNHFMQS